MSLEAFVLKNNLFASILNSIPAGISIAADPSCKEIVHNPVAAEYFRIRPWDNLSQSSDIRPPFRINHEGKELSQEEMPIQIAAWQGLEVRDFEVEDIWDDGVHKYSLWNTSPLKDEQGNITGAVACFKDITVQKQAEKRAQHQNELLQGINRILQEAMTCDTEDELRYACLQVAEHLTRSKIGFIGEFDPDGQHDAISNPGWDTRPFFTNDPVSYPDRISLPEGHPHLTSFLGVPLIHEGNTIGMISLAG